MNLLKESGVEKIKTDLDAGTGFWIVTGTIFILSYIALWFLVHQ